MNTFAFHKNDKNSRKTAEFIEENFRNKPIRFDFRVDEGRAEELHSFVDASLDTVVSTHVLCSVDDVEEVLHEIKRVLRSGGRFLFLEHVVDTDVESRRRRAQELVAPVWSVIADGCGFLDIARALNEHLADEFELRIEEFEAPFPRALSILKPHVRGVAIKR